MQRLHLAGHARTRAGAAREDDVGDPDVIRQIRERSGLAILIGQSEIGDGTDDAEFRRLAGVAIVLKNGDDHRQSEQAGQKTKADPE